MANSILKHLRNGLLLLLLGAAPILAQSPVERKANKLFANYAYAEAIELYEHIIKKNPDNKNAIRKLADSYRLTNNTEKTELWLRRVIELGIAWNEDYFYLAQALEAGGKNEEAKKQYEKFDQLMANDNRGKQFTNALENYAGFFGESECYKIENLSINSANSDFSASYFQNGIILVSNRQGSSFPKSIFPWNNDPWLDLYTSQGINDSTLQDASPISSKLNTKYHEGPASFHVQTQTLAFTRNNFFKGKVRRSADRVNKLKLFLSNYNGKVWSNVSSFPFNSDEYSIGHPAFSEDGKRIYFSSDMPGGQGGSDIYVSRFENNTWTKPENLGPEINTKGNELFPFVYKDSLLCFASNGWGGMGGLDNFRSVLKNGKPQKIENMGAPINSPADDFGFIMNNFGKNGFFSSNRAGGKGSDDIYRFTYKMRPTNIILVDQDEVKAVPNGRMKIYSNDELVFDLPADGEGKASAMLRPCLDYKVITTGDGFPQHEQVIKSNCPVSKKDDIRILMKRPKLYVNVFDKYTNKDISNAQVELLDLTSKAAAVNAETDAKGYVRFYLEPCHQYQVRAKKAGLPDAMKTLTAPCKQGELDAVARLGTGVAPLKGIPVEFTIVDEQSNAPVANAKIRMVNSQTKEVLDFMSDEKGFFETVVMENSSWTASCSQIGYFSTSKSKTDVKALKGIKKLSRELKLLKLREGGVIALEGIFYDLAKSNIRPDAAKVLDYVVLVMEENPTMIIELGSHTDSRGSDADNLKLSEARAKSAAEYIISKGIAASRITGKGYGETQLKNNCGNGVKCKEALHQENRRTEIRILDFD